MGPILQKIMKLLKPRLQFIMSSSLFFSHICIASEQKASIDYWRCTNRYFLLQSSCIERVLVYERERHLPNQIGYISKNVNLLPNLNSLLKTKLKTFLTMTSHLPIKKYNMAPTATFSIVKSQGSLAERIAESFSTMMDMKMARSF